jgi:hypothetical protein
MTIAFDLTIRTVFHGVGIESLLGDEEVWSDRAQICKRVYGGRFPCGC